VEVGVDVINQSVFIWGPSSFQSLAGNKNKHGLLGDSNIRSRRDVMEIQQYEGEDECECIEAGPGGRANHFSLRLSSVLDHGFRHISKNNCLSQILHYLLLVN
jgi:hypothetical protein